MAIASGLTSAITNPLHDEVMKAIMASNVLMGNDSNCTRWIKKYRESSNNNENTSVGGGRRNRRRNRQKH